MHRRPFNKKNGAKAFRGRASKVHKLNMMNPPRGGIRL